jgi:hypothetical protein
MAPPGGAGDGSLPETPYITQERRMIKIYFLRRKISKFSWLLVEIKKKLCFITKYCTKWTYRKVTISHRKTYSASSKPMNSLKIDINLSICAIKHAKKWLKTLNLFVEKWPSHKKLSLAAQIQIIKSRYEFLRKNYFKLKLFFSILNQFFACFIAQIDRLRSFINEFIGFDEHG